MTAVRTWLLIVLAVYTVASVIAFTAYGLDKRAARSGRRRIPERKLHLLELCGGWPGAWVGQRVFRHKTIDRRYRLIFAFIIILHAAGWVGILVLWVRNW